MKELSRAEVAALFAALADASASVRLAALRALVRLPLDRTAWMGLSSFIMGVLHAPLEGDDFTTQTRYGIPYDELIQAAIFVPTKSVRDHLHGLLQADDVHLRSAVAHALATARDSAALPLLLAQLRGSSESRRTRAAKSLSLLPVDPNSERTIQEAYGHEKDPDVRFWLALALARMGGTAEIQAVVNACKKQKLDLRELHGDPREFIKQLKPRGPFPEHIRELLEREAAVVEEGTEKEILLALTTAGMPEKSEERPEPPPPPPDAQLESLASTAAESIAVSHKLNQEVVQTFQPELLYYLPHEVETEAVTLLFQQAIEHPELGMLGNDIVTGVASLGKDFAPDIEGLFHCYRTLKAPAGDLQIIAPWGLSQQIAWTASRADNEVIVEAMSPAFGSEDEQERKLAAQLIEEATRYSFQDYAPIFGGGGGPGDLMPATSELIEQVAFEESSKKYDWTSRTQEGATRSSAYIWMGDADDIKRYRESKDKGFDEKVQGEKQYRKLDIEHDQEFTGRPRSQGKQFEEETGFDVASDEKSAGRTPSRRQFEEDEGKSGASVTRVPSEGKEGTTKEERPAVRVYRKGVSRSASTRSIKPQELEPPEKWVVNTGFASPSDPDQKINNTMPLKAGGEYYFWLDRSAPDSRTSGEKTPTDIQKFVPVGARLTVAVFGFQDGIEVVSGSDIGEIEVTDGGSFTVVRQPMGEAPKGSREGKIRLFFPVRIPQTTASVRMRCNIYWGQLLLQSRLIEAQVMFEPVEDYEQVWFSTLDYNLTRQLEPEHLLSLPEHRLSILLNSNGDGTNSFHILGSDGNETYKQDDIRFREGMLHSLIINARGTLRIASWDSEEEYKPAFKYKYKVTYPDRKKNLERMAPDLINLARWGYEFYAVVQGKIAGRGNEPGQADLDDPDSPESKLTRLMLKPGVVQIAMKESPSDVLPAAMIYDYPFDTGRDEISMCPTFESAFLQSQTLHDLPCFNGACPSRDDPYIVCPGGFWGFRHYLGMPLSVKNGPPVPATINVKGALKLAAGLATNLQFVTNHVERMRKLRVGLSWADSSDRDKIFDLLKDHPHLVYFYCHGGLARGAPYLQVGSAASPGQINSSNFRGHKIVWNEPRPLVFINGCHTTAVDPLLALEFITPLVTYSKCAGVIGTEITIFEEMATEFAQACFERFYAGETIGEAIRNSRLKLLADGNPLGLVYIPFVMSGLKLTFQN